MTDIEVISRALGVLDPGPVVMHGVRRGGCLLLVLPAGRESVARALRLYQPQRRLARALVSALQGLMRIGLEGYVLPKVRVMGEAVAVTPELPGIEHGTCGMLLGSPEHRVRRVIASYRNAGMWEVAKISFGEAGARILEQEARALEELQAQAAGVPCLLGLHRAAGATLLRMPYLTGDPIQPGESGEALRLLDQWIMDQSPKAITSFPEWAAIESSLSGCGPGRMALERLSLEVLRPVICHGDFARWNLLRMDDGGLIVLDWEWGHKDGLPGIDLVHYFLQDARLVKRLDSIHAIEMTRSALAMPVCREYLRKSGWSGDCILPMVACLAYKQGAGHQENAEILRVAAGMMSGYPLDPGGGAIL